MLAAVVLAGGGAVRMGGLDKPLLSLGRRTILAEILLRLAGQATAIALSANGDPGRFASYPLPILPDTVADHGPLAGVLRGLEWAAEIGADEVLTVPGDTPFIPEDLAHRLSRAPAWASSAGHVHPLVALWPTSARDHLRTWEGRRVRSFGELVGMRTVIFDDPAAFLNVNTPADLAIAVEAARAMD